MHLKQSQGGSTTGRLVFEVLAELAATRSSEEMLPKVREFTFLGVVLNEIKNLQVSKPRHLSPLRRRHFLGLGTYVW